MWSERIKRYFRTGGMGSLFQKYFAFDKTFIYRMNE